MRAMLILAAALLLAGCVTTGAHTVAVDVQTIDRPVPVPCTITWPAKPVAHVDNVQLSGDNLADLVRLWRAAEAELEERIAYERLLEAAMQACTRGDPRPE